MKAEFINPFLTASYSVLNMVLGALPTKGPLGARTDNTTSHPVNIVCGVTGALQGQIILGMGQATANRIASAMSGRTLKIFDSFVASAIAELCNMISGNALMSLSDAGYVCDITPPTIVKGTNVEISTLEIVSISISLVTQCGDLDVTVGLCEANSSAHRSRASLAS